MYGHMYRSQVYNQSTELWPRVHNLGQDTNAVTGYTETHTDIVDLQTQ